MSENAIINVPLENGSTGQVDWDGFMTDLVTIEDNLDGLQQRLPEGSQGYVLATSLNAALDLLTQYGAAAAEAGQAGLTAHLAYVTAQIARGTAEMYSMLNKSLDYAEGIASQEFVRQVEDFLAGVEKEN